MIGLTGGIASGKSTVAARLKRLGAFVADADDISRRVMELPGVLEKVRQCFGDEVFDSEGRLKRKALANIALATPQGTAALNAITHPAITEELLAEAHAAEAEGRYPLVVIDVPLLIETGMHQYCSSVWLVTANKETRIRRIIERDGVTRQEALLRMERQMSDEEKLAFATTVIDNDGTLEQLIVKVDEAFAAEVKNKGEH